jgi:heme/copper-type cytochrome/quinol oxidase subunit 1
MKTMVVFLTVLCLAGATHADEPLRLREPELKARRLKNVGIGLVLAGSALASIGMTPLAIGWTGEYDPSTQRMFDVGASFVGIGVVAGALGTILWIAGGTREHNAMGLRIGLSSNGGVVVRF